tara:strand:- start:635 stop:1939 length:1305 start_codon:yes stop_codon:yes gene_type:complete
MRILVLLFLYLSSINQVFADTEILGPRDCFWARGPFSADPYINVAYPDSNVYYWAAAFSMPVDSTLEIKGEYPYSRYMSFFSYNERGKPIGSLTDFQIQSKATNPFILGNQRSDLSRSYSIEVVNKNPLSDLSVSTDNPNRNILFTPEYRKNQQLVVYRIYLPDKNIDITGGVKLPQPVLTLSDGSKLVGEETCETLNTSQALQVSFDALGIPPNEYRELISQPDKPDTWPAHNPPKWFIQLDRKSLIGMYTGEIDPNAPRSEGGFYPNLDNQYIRSIINRKHGKVLIVRGKAPTTPKTYFKTSFTEEEDLRYWSLCSNQSFVNTRVNDCLHDEEIPIDKNGFYTIAISREEDRPRNAINECGIAWLPMADDGDGMFDDDVTIIQFRHLLPSDKFEHSIQKVKRQDQLEEIMGPYMPKARYLMPNQVETFFPCK